MRLAGFKTAESRAEFLAAYEAVLEGWPAHEARTVTTGFGETHVLVSGPRDGMPLLLLPGMNAGGAITWLENVDALSREHRVYALDMLGGAGRSNATAGLATVEDALRWLTGVMDGLGLASAHVIGHGQGAFLGLQLGLRNPERVRSLVMLDPPNTFAGMNTGAVLKAVVPFLFPSPARMRPLLLGAFPLTPRREAWLTAVCLGMRNYRTKKRVMPRRVPADELSRLAVPVLLVVGSRGPSAAQEMVANARTAIPHISAEVVDGAGHMLMIEQPDAVHTRILAFLDSRNPKVA